MRRFLSFALAAAAPFLIAVVPGAQAPAGRLTYLYDNTVAMPGVKADWGFACLVESDGRTVLFDTGAKPEVLRENMSALKVDAGRIQAVVLSHEHGDHTLGVGALPAHPGLPVYVGEHFRLPPAATAALDRIGATRVTVKAEATQIFPGFLVSEEIAGQGAYEDALVVDTAEGSIVLVGCAHPGILAMLQRIAATTKRPISTVIGGFHLLQTPPDQVKTIIEGFKALGVARVGPTHCTGGDAIRMFREAYGPRFVAGGVGTVVSVPAPK